MESNASTLGSARALTMAANVSCTEVEFHLHGRRLAAKRWRNTAHQGDTIPTMALHGWLDNANSFDVLAPLLLQQLPALDILALDFAGHGHSEHRQQGVNYLGILDVQDVIGVANLLGWTRFDLLGHSMGAEVGGNLIGLFRERVERFVGLDGFTEGCDDTKVFEYARKSLELNLATASASPAQAQDQAQHRLKVFPSLQAMAARVSEATGQSLPSAQLLVARGATAVEEGFAWQSDARVRWGDTLRLPSAVLDGILARYPGRILIVAANEGAKWFRPTIEARRTRFANLRVIDLPGNHHFHMDLESAQEIAPHVIEFVRR